MWFYFPQQTQEQWQTVFFICAGVYTFGTLVYVMFGSGELQPWARTDTMDTNVSLQPEEQDWEAKPLNDHTKNV